jgi:general secretion pathway protein A
MVMASDRVEPFSISPNPLFLFHTDNVKALLHSARSTVNKRQGLVTILSPVGCGKTTLLRHLWMEFDTRGDTLTCFIPTPIFASTFAMVKSVAAGFKQSRDGIEGEAAVKRDRDPLDPQRSLRAQLDGLEEFLAEQYQAGRNVCLLIDEGQILKDQYLELLRSFLNFESNEAKTIQLVIAGQLEMWERFKTKKNEPLRSRVHSYALINPLTDVETEKMIAFRCAKAEVANPFPPDVVERIYELTKGVPRHIIKVCGKAMEYMEMEGAAEVTRDMVDGAAEDAALEVETEAAA